MKQHLFGGEDLTPEERLEMLEANASGIEDDKRYFHGYSDEELNEKKTELSEVDIKLYDIDVRKKAIMDELKKEIKPLSNEHSDLLQKIKNRGEFVEARCFKMVDQEQGLVAYYNEQGVLVESRPINPSERQTNIFQIKTGTNN